MLARSDQPQIAQWNLARLAEALLALIDPAPERAVALATDRERAFSGLYETRWLAMMRGKLGLQGEEAEDRVLVADLLDWMRANDADHTNTFRALSAGEVAAEGAHGDADLGRCTRSSTSWRIPMMKSQGWSAMPSPTR